MKKLILILLTLLALGLRLYKLDQHDFIEDEHTMVKAAAYLYYPHEKEINQSSLSSRIWALMLNNETVPNLFTQVYLWNFVSQSPTEIHQSRSWPQLYVMSWVYRIFGISEWSSRIISVIAGVLLIPAGYWLTRSIGWTKNLSLIYSASLTWLFQLIDMSRNARMYSWFGLMFLLAINPKLWKKPILGLLSLILSYWLHLLTLLIPLAYLIYGMFWKNKKIVGWLGGSVLILLLISFWTKMDIFFQYFWGWKTKPDWQYIKMILDFPWPWWINFILIASQFKNLLKNKYLSWLLILWLTYLFFLIFLGKMPAGGAYIAHLMPITLLLIIYSIRNHRNILIIFCGFIFLRWVMGFNYLYNSRNGQAKLTQAYRQIMNNFQPGDQIAGIQIRDYYLQNLPKETQLIDLQVNQDFEFNNSGFVVWEKEKFVHFQPKTLEYIKNNFQHLAGEGLDNNHVEIYSFRK